MSLSIEKTPNPSDTPTFVKIKYDNLEVALEWIRDISQAINDRLLREGGDGAWSPGCVVWNVRNYRETSFGEFNYFKVVCLNDNPTAFAIASNVNESIVELFLIGTKPKYNGKHLGTAIMKDVIRKAQKKGYSQLKIIYEKQAKSFYVKFSEREQLKAKIKDSYFLGEWTGGKMLITIPPFPGQPEQ